MLKNTHYHQFDAAVLDWWKTNNLLNGWTTLTWFADLYLLNSKLCLSFLERLDKKSKWDPYADLTEVKKKIVELEKEWIKYDIKYVSK